MRFGHLGLYGFAVSVLGVVALPGTAEGACLSKPATDRNGRVVKQRVIAPASEFARYRAAGYIVEECGVSLEQLRQSVANVCRAAAEAPAQIQARVVSSHGATLSGLCASGRAGLAEMETSSTQQ